jgi:hypothetical protein
LILLGGATDIALDALEDSEELDDTERLDTEEELLKLRLDDVLLPSTELLTLDVDELICTELTELESSELRLTDDSLLTATDDGLDEDRLLTCVCVDDAGDDSPPLPPHPVTISANTNETGRYSSFIKTHSSRRMINR